jgi:hypothetical protein
VNDPVDDTTQVVTFMKGLNDGPIKTHLFRVYPQSLEEAISLAIQEDFSMLQAYVHSAEFRPHRSNRTLEDTAEPMDLSYANVTTSSSRPTALPLRPTTSSSKPKGVCRRCQQSGHWAYECMAPRPASGAFKAKPKRAMFRSGGRGEGKGPRRGGAKNGKSQ